MIIAGNINYVSYESYVQKARDFSQIYSLRPTACNMQGGMPAVFQ
jgi:hypothetical protein